MDKAFWTSILEQGGKVPEGYTAFGLMPALLAGLGSPDPGLRDELCLEISCYWVMKGLLSGEELKHIGDQLVTNLRAGIGQGENDQVFLRTFSAELLRFAVAYDARARVLPPGELAAIFAAALDYFADEQDWRGYDPIKGWAHSVAHTADLLMALAEHPLCGAEELRRILTAIGAKLQTKTHYYLDHNEDFRLGLAALAILRREVLPAEDIVAWLHDLGGSERYKALTPEDNVWRHNTVAFLTALYVMVSHQDLPEGVRPLVLSAVHAALKSYYPRFV